ncbi:MmgE/PrpD family protein [uncultured Draconibacterium sp.]|uniref:MmgE/PrpD family protein n=1 Tax=uncultured Draconibacterium sp. TaxID=1573823 RepID=UPI0029C61906|nr:MmgE/PrpD family protein [uncultured Draconibacterium sp.]
MKNITTQYIDSLFNLSKQEYSEDIIRIVKRFLLDYIGVTIAGAKILETENGKYFEQIQTNGIYKVIGYNKATDIYSAALINGINSHICELDDGVRQGSIHPGSPIFSALLALADSGQISGTDLIRGAIVGYEASIRLAIAIQPHHRNLGFHATATCGTVGVAIAVSAALNYSKEKYHDVLSAACTNLSGMLAVTKGSSELKPYHGGKAAVSGLMAAIVGGHMFSGLDNVLDGDWGVLNMYTDSYNVNPLIAPISMSSLGIHKVYMKPFAACRHAHPSIEAILNIKKDHIIDIANIDRINVFTYKLATKGHEHTKIEGITSAKMSIPYGISVAMILGNAGLYEYTEDIISKQEILDLTSKVTVVFDEELDALVPQKRPAKVEVVLNDNSVFTSIVELAKGEPENPLTENEAKNKFKSLCQFAKKSDVEIYQIFNSVSIIDNSIEELIKLL